MCQILLRKRRIAWPRISLRERVARGHERLVGLSHHMRLLKEKICRLGRGRRRLLERSRLRRGELRLTILHRLLRLGARLLRQLR